MIFTADFICREYIYKGMERSMVIKMDGNGGKVQ